MAAKKAIQHATENARSAGVQIKIWVSLYKGRPMKEIERKREKNEWFLNRTFCCILRGDFTHRGTCFLAATVLIDDVISERTPEVLVGYVEVNGIYP